jgi:hypothetical protein
MMATSKARRERRNGTAAEIRKDAPPPNISLCNPPIPDLDGVDSIFGKIAHMPKYDTVPDEFKRYGGNDYCDFISTWFFRGLTPEDRQRLTPREHVDEKKALIAIQAILRSFEPKHEHKEAGAAYLLSQWFTIEPKQKKK